MHRRVLQALPALVLIGALTVAPVGAEPNRSQPKKWTITPITGGETLQATKATSTGTAKSTKSLLRRTDSKRVNVIVKFDYDSVAAYRGGLPGLRPTSPEVTGRSLKANRSAVRAYGGYVRRAEHRIARTIRSRIASARITQRYRVVYGGVAMSIRANKTRSLARVRGVVAVQKDRLAKPQTDATPEFLGADQAWNEISGPSTSGEGVIVGVLDTGIWPEHPSLVDPGISHPGGTFGCEFGDGSDPALGDPFTCNDKLVGAYAFTDTYMAVLGAVPGEFCNNTTGECSARDSGGHGTHTLTTAAGGPAEASIFGIDRGHVSGMAPGAHVIAYRVCLLQGCFQSDSVAAVEQALLDGVDVINFSISGGSNAYSDAVELAFLDAYAGGILVNASAGNAGPGAGTANHAGPWTNTVGASTSDRMWLTTLHLEADNGDTFDATGATITHGIADFTDTVVATDVGGDVFCSTPLAPGSATGKVVVCSRGVTGRAVKSFNVMQGGAAGMILYNPTHQDLFTDNFWVPTIMLDGPSPAAELVSFLNSHSGEQSKWDTGTATTVQGDVMATFSSRGPLGDFIKPDVTAPGLQILAGNSPEPIDVASGPPGELFQSIAGTSMSSPHSAGVSALVKAAHPDWTPGQIKSALMTSSVQDVLKEDGVTPSDPFDRGAGSIRANRAIAPTITFDVEAADYFASASDPLGRPHLNLPSINVPVMGGEFTTTRTLENVSGRNQHFQASTEAPAGTSITVEPKAFDVPAGQSATIEVTIDATAAAEGQYFGQVTLDPTREGAVSAVLPVAFFKQQGDVTLDNSCDPTTFPRRTVTNCQVTVQNNSPMNANAELEVSAPPKGITIQNVSPPGVPTATGFTWSGELSGAVPPTIDSITPGGSPAGGYLPLSAFGVAPISGVGDETITNFNVPSFNYGHEAYTRLGMVSNGYVVVGGGTADDVEFVPSGLPNTARPNNTLAPFWTDLDPGAGGAMRIATLTDGINTWIVSDWEGVPTFGAASDTHSFQTWLQIGATEGVFMAHGDIGVGSSDGLKAGAENRSGTSGVEITPADNTDWTVNTSPPQPGESLTITYDALGRRVGTWDVIARLTTDVTVGTITDVVTLIVTPSG